MTTKNIAKNKVELEKAIKDTLSDITEVLAKSGYPLGDAKEDSHSEDQGSELQKADDEDCDDLKKMDPNAAPAEEQFESPEQASAEMGMEGEGYEEGGYEEGGDDMGEMQEHMSQMSDEELGEMIQMLSQEQETRSAAQQEGPEAGFEEEGGMPPQEPEMEKGYKDDYLKLTKSLSGISGAIEKINATVGKLAKDVTTIKKGRKRVTSKAAVSQRIEALSKSDPAPKAVERLTKSETSDFLVSEVRRGSDVVNTRTIIDLGYVENDDQLAQFQNSLTKQGVKFPTV